MGVCNYSMFCCTLLYVHSSIAIILMGKRELNALLNLFFWCLVMVERLFLAVPRGRLQFVIVVFPDHTHLLFFKTNNRLMQVKSMIEHSAILFTCIKLPRGFKTFVLSTVKPVLGDHSERRPKIGFQDRLLLNAGQKYCRMLQGEHSAILLTFLKQPFAINTFLLSIF